MGGSTEEYAIAAHLVTARESLQVALSALGVARLLSDDGPIKDAVNQLYADLRTNDRRYAGYTSNTNRSSYDTAAYGQHWQAKDYRINRATNVVVRVRPSGT